MYISKMFYYPVIDVFYNLLLQLKNYAKRCIKPEIPWIA